MHVPELFSSEAQREIKKQTINDGSEVFPVVDVTNLDPMKILTMDLNKPYIVSDRK